MSEGKFKVADSEFVMLDGHGEALRKLGHAYTIFSGKFGDQRYNHLEQIGMANGFPVVILDENGGMSTGLECALADDENLTHREIYVALPYKLSRGGPIVGATVMYKSSVPIEEVVVSVKELTAALENYKE